jgi:hypothetical protein
MSDWFSFFTVGIYAEFQELWWVTHLDQTWWHRVIALGKYEDQSHLSVCGHCEKGWGQCVWDHIWSVFHLKKKLIKKPNRMVRYDSYVIWQWKCVSRAHFPGTSERYGPGTSSIGFRGPFGPRGKVSLGTGWCEGMCKTKHAYNCIYVYLFKILT